MPLGSLDSIYRSILLSKYFVKGWGKPENLKRLFAFRKVISNRDYIYKLIPKNYSITIEKEEAWADYRVLEGHFKTPLDDCLPGIIPEEVQNAHFQIILPHKWEDENYKPMCLHLAGTGDHYFWKRRNFMCKPLLKEAGIGGIILENPYYGSRKPKDQVRSNLHNVSDIFVMGGCLMLESLVLFNWCEQQGLGPLGVTGLSMGGHMASLAATNWPKPLVLVPCLSWSTASAVFTRGVMSGAIPWDVLKNQYFSNDIYRDEILKMVTIIEDDAFRAGQEFVQNYPNAIDKLNEMQSAQHKQAAQEGGAGGSVADTIQGQTAQAAASVDQGQAADVDNTESCPLMVDAATSNETESRTLNSGISGPFMKQDENCSVDLGTTHLTAVETDSKTRSVNDLAASLAKMSKRIDEDPQVASEGTMKEKHDLGAGILTNIAESKLNILNFGVKSSKDQSVKIRTEVKDYQLRKVVGRKLPFSLLGMSPAEVRDREALQFMRGIMDECTHLKNFSIPVDTSLIIAICATEDGYVPREGVTHLTDVWPGAEIRYINTGHVGAYLLHQPEFRKAIKDAFQRAKENYPRS